MKGSLLRSGVRSFLPAMLLLALPVLFLLRGAALAQSVSLALRRLGTALIPALFPFLLLSNLLSCPPVAARLLRVLRSPLLLCLLLALLGGYPAGAVVLLSLTKEGMCTREQAARCLPFLSLPSPAFVCSFLGPGLLRSRALGFLLYAAVLLGQLPAFLPLLVKQNAPTLPRADRPLPALSAGVLPAVLHQTAGSVCAVSLSLLASSLLLPFLALLPLSPPAIAFLHSLLEIGGGVFSLCEAGGSRMLFSLAAALSFGGAGVFLQLAALLGKSGISLWPHLLTRPLCALSSALSLWLLLRLFPPDVQTAVPVFRPLSGVSPLSTCLLFFLLGLLLALPAKQSP